MARRGNDVVGAPRALADGLLPAAPATRAPARVRPDWLGSTLALLPLLVLYVVVCAIAQPGGDPVRDEPNLLPAASRLLAGHLVPSGPVLDPRDYLWHGPGLPALLAPLVGLDLPLRAIRFVDPVLLGAAVLLFHHLLRRRLAARPALVWTYAFGLYVPFFAVLPELHKEPLSVLLVVAGMTALSRGLARGGPVALAGAGLALAALAMVRLEYGWVAFALLALALVGWARRPRGSVVRRRLVAVAAVAVAGCIPWLAYTHHLTGRSMYWGTSSGLSLFWMSPTQPGETGAWHEPRDVFRDPSLAAQRPLFARVARLDPVRADDALRARAMVNIRARPLQYARNLVANVGRLFFAWPMRPELSPVRVGADVLFNGLLLGALGWMLVGLRRARRRRPLPPEALPIAAFTILGLLVHLPVSASPRMLLPLVPPLLWLAAQAAAASGAPPRSAPASYPIISHASPSESAAMTIPARSSTA